MKAFGRWRPGKWVAIVTTISVLSLGVGCSKKNNQPANQQQTAGTSQSFTSTGSNTQPQLPAQGSGYAHVTYRPNVHVMEEDEGRHAIIGASTYENALLFDSSDATARALRAGDAGSNRAPCKRWRQPSRI